MESYRVIYEIEVDAENHMNAALKVEEILKNMNYRPSFKINKVSSPAYSKVIDLEMEEVEE